MSFGFAGESANVKGAWPMMAVSVLCAALMMVLVALACRGLNLNAIRAAWRSGVGRPWWKRYAKAHPA